MTAGDDLSHMPFTDAIGLVRAAEIEVREGWLEDVRSIVDMYRRDYGDDLDLIVGVAMVARALANLAGIARNQTADEVISQLYSVFIGSDRARP